MESTQEKKSIMKRISKIFTAQNMSIGILISIVFFAFQYWQSEKAFDDTLKNFNITLKGLEKIEQSLSTKYIGIFPDYLNEINQLLLETLEQKEISHIVILADLLFYGAFYHGSEFKKMIYLINELSMRGNKITIAYYNNVREWRDGRMFREVVQESWIRSEDISKLTKRRNEIAEILNSHEERTRPQDRDRRERTGGERTGGERNRLRLLKADSIASELYFVLYRDDKEGGEDSFGERKKNILKPFHEDRDNLELFEKIDEIKKACFDKEIKSITFNDIFNMYVQVTDVLLVFLKDRRIETIPLNEHLTMFTWSNGKKALFVFPGRFGSDEIGFISHDKAILDYIDKMLYGVRDAAND